MMQFNQYNLYSYNANIAQSSILDEVDNCKQELLRITEYDAVKDFLTTKFGKFEGEKWVEYPDISKYVYLYIDEEKVEFCAIKDNKQYWGRGWRLEEVKE